MKNEKTVKGYVKDIELFLHFLTHENIKLIQTKEIHIRQFNYSLKEKGYSEHTIARKNSALRLFFKFLRKQGAMENVG